MIENKHFLIIKPILNNIHLFSFACIFGAIEMTEIALKLKDEKTYFFMNTII